LIRFRWAVCQIDVLKNVKCDQVIVNRALKNLPKTLDETYERIFLSIPQEQWTFMTHMFRWLIYFLKDGTTPRWHILVEAARSSAAEFDIHVNDIHYDIPTIKEICGCLISFWYSEPPLGSIFTHLVDNISFAHYTVQEYLISKRIADSPIAHFAVCSNKLREEILRAMLLHLLALEANSLDAFCEESASLCEKSAGRSPEIVMDLRGNFTILCLDVARRMLLHPWSQLLNNATLFNLTISLMDASKPHFAVFRKLLHVHFHSFGYVQHRSFWTVHRIHASAPVEASIFLNQLLTSANGTGTLELAERYMRTTGENPLFQTNLDFRAQLTLDGTSLAGPNWLKFTRFSGTIVDVIAQIPDWRFRPQLEMLLKLGEGLFDCSKALLSAATSHVEYCSGGPVCETRDQFCALKCLLEAGADPNGTGYRTRPLQITVGRRDYTGTKILLEAGANPNYSGDPNGVAWEDGTALARFDRLHNKRPLLICQDELIDGENSFNNESPFTNEICDRIRLLLLSHGADERRMRDVGYP
jgi:hypothetical protein